VSRYKKKNKNKMEFSKKIFVCTSLATLMVMIFTGVMVWRTNDLSPLMYLIPAIFAELATATAFYYNKAKAENKIKLMKSYKVDPNNEDFNQY
jgi:L-asparagine transporter-like permease